MKDNAASLVPSSPAPAGQCDVIVRPRQDDLWARVKGRGPREVWRGRKAVPESTRTQDKFSVISSGRTQGQCPRVGSAGDAMLLFCHNNGRDSYAKGMNDKTSTKTGEGRCNFLHVITLPGFRTDVPAPNLPAQGCPRRLYQDASIE